MIHIFTLMYIQNLIDFFQNDNKKYPLYMQEEINNYNLPLGRMVTTPDTYM